MIKKKEDTLLHMLERVQKEGGNGVLVTLTENDAWVRTFGNGTQKAYLWDLPQTLDAMNAFLEKFSETFTSFAPGMEEDHHFRTGSVSGTFQCRCNERDGETMTVASFILDELDAFA